MDGLGFTGLLVPAFMPVSVPESCHRVPVAQGGDVTFDIHFETHKQERLSLYSMIDRSARQEFLWSAHDADGVHGQSDFFTGYYPAGGDF